MKQDSNEAKQLAALLKRLSSKYKPEAPPACDPVMQMVVGFMQWNATFEQADQAVNRLMAEVVDVNDLRVSLEYELLASLGEDYPQSHERIARLREALNEIYVREHAMEMRSVASQGKKDQRHYLDTLPGMTPYVAALVMLLSFGGHAVAVDDKLAAMLVEEGVLEAGTTPEEAEAKLQRMIKADDAVETHLLLQAWADDSPMPKGALAETAAAEAAATQTPAAKTTKSSKSGKPAASKTTKTAKKATKKATKKASKTAVRRAKKK